jgi:Caspase domain
MKFDPLDNLKQGEATYRLLLIGVNDYTDAKLPSLNYAVSDCQHLAEALDRATTVFPSRVSSVHVGSHTEGSITLKEIDQAVDRLVAGVKPEDTLFFYFAGHGLLDPQTQENLFLCLSDTDQERLEETGLSVKDLLARFKNSGAGQQVFVLDACHSGKALSAATSRGSRVLPRSESTLEPIDRSVDAQFIPKLEEVLQTHSGQVKDFYAIVSCGSTQQSWEFPALQHGAFTYYLLEGIRGKAANAEGAVTISNLFHFVHDRTEEYVHTHSGCTQKPVLISRGDHKMIIGLEPSTNPEFDPLTKRQQRYSEEVWSVLKQHYPIRRSDHADHAVAIWHHLNALAEKLGLSPAEINQIEAEMAQRFEHELKTYQQCAVSRLFKQYPDHLNIFHQLRQQFGFAEAVAIPRESAAREMIEQYRTHYQRHFSEAVYEYGTPLNTDIRENLQSIGKQMGFSASALKSLEREVQNKFWQHQASYRLRYVSQIYRDGTPDIAALKQLQQDLKLSDRIVGAIEIQEMHRYQQRTQQYEEALSQIIYQSAAANVDGLKPLQLKLGLEDSLAKKITNTVLARCHADQKRYREALIDVIYQHIDLDVTLKTNLQELAQSLGLGSELIETIELECQYQLAEHKQLYRDALYQAIHQPVPLSPASLDDLIALQQQLGLGDRLVDALKQEVYVLNQDPQAEDQPPLALGTADQIPDDTHLLRTEATTELSQELPPTPFIELPIEPLNVAEPPNLALQTYREALTHAIRQENLTLSAARQHLLPQQYAGAFTDETIDDLADEVMVALKHDQAKYCEAVMQALRQESPLTSTALQHLQTLQQTLNFGDAITYALRQSARLDFLQEAQGIYERAVATHLRQQYPLSPELRQELERLADRLGLKPSVAQNMEARLTIPIATYQTNFTGIIRRCDLTGEDWPTLVADQRPLLEEYRTQCGLAPEDTESIEQRVIQVYQQQQQSYAATITNLIGQHGEIPETKRELIDNLRLAKSIDPMVAVTIETRLLAEQPAIVPSAPVSPFSALPTPEALALPTPEVSRQPVNSPPEVEVQRPNYRPRLVFGAVALLVGLVGVWAIGQRPRQPDLTLVNIKALLDKQDYVACINQANAVTANSPLSAGAKELLSQCQSAQTASLLSQAETAEKQGELIKAMELARKIPKDSQVFSQAEPMVERLATQLLQKANVSYEQGDFEAALQALKSIPNTSIRSEKATALMTKFTQTWQANQTAFAKVKQAHQAQKWATVLSESQKINHEHWKKQVAKFVQTAEMKLVRQQPQLANPIPTNPASRGEPAPIQANPGYESPQDEAPAYEAPRYEAPAYEAPAYQAPSYEAPTYQPPAYTPPPQEAPPPVAPAAPPKEEVL